MLLAHKILFFESPLLTAGVCLAGMILGLFVGSRAHAISWRLAHGEPVYGRSRCRECGEELALRDSLPLVGWLANRGTCPHCGKPLGIDQPATELLCAGIFASIVLRYGIAYQTLEVLAIMSVLLVASLTSLWDYIIPNGCIVAAVLVRVAYLVGLFFMGEDVTQPALTSIVGGLALGIPLAIAVFLSNAMLAREVSGMGTVKLASVVGIFLGWQQGLFAMAAACALWMFVWVVSPSKVLEVEVAGGVHRSDDPDAPPAPSPRELRATLEEDIAEPMRLIPFAPTIAIACWGMLLIGVAPAVWNAPIF